GTFSSLDPAADRRVVSGPLVFDEDELLRLRLFLDRSVLELFIDDRIAATQRLYPTRTDSDGLKFLVEKGEVHIVRLSLWTLKPIWPNTVPTRH
ncbi:MAG TPA: GH32 C-terminal domain-containing protein, partial [Chthoniobacterales bacterium]